MMRSEIKAIILKHQSEVSGAMLDELAELLSPVLHGAMFMGTPLSELSDEDRVAMREWAIHSEHAPPLALLGISLTPAGHRERATWRYDASRGGYYP
jgi:hypothetical protein